MAFLPADRLTFRPNAPKRRRTRLLTERIFAGGESFSPMLVCTSNGYYGFGITSRRQFLPGARIISFATAPGRL